MISEQYEKQHIEDLQCIRALRKTNDELRERMSEQEKLALKYKRIFPVAPGIMNTDPNNTLRRPNPHDMTAMANCLVTILFGSDKWCCLLDDALTLFTRVLRKRKLGRFKVIDCVYAADAVFDYFKQMGTGSGANRQKLKDLQVVTGAMMKLDNNGVLVNRLLFTDKGQNILPQKNKKHRNIFVRKCQKRRQRFNNNSQSRTLSRDYSTEKRVPSLSSFTLHTRSSR